MKKLNLLGALLLLVSSLALCQVTVFEPSYSGFAHRRTLEQAWGASSPHYRVCDSVACDADCGTGCSRVTFSGEVLFGLNPGYRATWHRFREEGQSSFYYLDVAKGDTLKARCLFMVRGDSLSDVDTRQVFAWPMLDSVLIGGRMVGYQHRSIRCGCDKHRKGRYQEGPEVWLPERELYLIPLSRNLACGWYVDRDVPETFLQAAISHMGP